MEPKLIDHIDPEDINNLIAKLAAKIEDDQEIVHSLEICDLQPTSRAAILAAQAAVNVLLAYEIEQEAGQ